MPKKDQIVFSKSLYIFTFLLLEKLNEQRIFLFFVPLAAQSLSKQPNLEAMVKTLAPALLAELAKMKSASSSSAPTAASSSSSNVAKRAGTAKTLKAKPSFQRPATSSTAKSNVGVR